MVAAVTIVRCVIAVLNHAGIPHVLVGSFAWNCYEVRDVIPQQERDNLDWEYVHTWTGRQGSQSELRTIQAGLAATRGSRADVRMGETG